MFQDQSGRGQDHGSDRSVPGPYGERITLKDLPRPGTHRWVIRRKALVVAAVDGGLLTLDEACERYHLSQEEFSAWARDYHEFGLQGLRVTRLQHYRKKHEIHDDSAETLNFSITSEIDKAAE